MPDDLDRLVAGVRADPRNTLTLQALADRLEEMGADAASVRALTVDGPTVLVASFGENFSDEDARQLWDELSKVAEFFQRHTGYAVMAVTKPHNVTLSAIRGRPAEDAYERGVAEGVRQERVRQQVLAAEKRCWLNATEPG